MPQVPFLTDDKLDRLMEEQIEASCLWPQSKNECFDVEAFLEGHLRVVFDKDVTLGPDVLGEVVFERGKKIRVLINVDLTAEMEHPEALWQVGRWRMTVAHECAHVILHGPLFRDYFEQRGLWDEDESGPRVHRCFKKGDVAIDWDEELRDICNRYGWNSGQLVNGSEAYQRMEFQANKAGAALLMPRSEFCRLARKAFDFANERTPNLLVEERQDWVVERLSQHFRVSKQAAHIRCKTLQLLDHAAQTRLI